MNHAKYECKQSVTQKLKMSTAKEGKESVKDEVHTRENVPLF